jgi:phosphate/sulfate permease
MANPAGSKTLPTRPALSTQSTTHALIGGGVVAAAVTLSLVPPPLLVPAFSLIAFAGAALAGGVAWLTNAKRHGPHVTTWDVAGAGAFLGIAAGMFSEPASVMQLLGLATPT